jgi:hypothetical protein
MDNDAQTTEKDQVREKGVYSGYYSLKEKTKKRSIRIYYIFACFAILLSLIWIIFIVCGVELLRLILSNSCGSGEGGGCGWILVALSIPFLFLVVFYIGTLVILQITMRQLRKNGGVQKKIQILHRIIFGYAIFVALFCASLVICLVVRSD